ncbi:ThuA domain-containing protein [Thalassotalea hakodatensis]|uniref:ThuA domain-containing protein n=1 Tax=Thalassotalea hakodatensis TaxID=3030492 RepID=UPI0025746705|nr:ThuA domain-containing protein [Thalassotalea hakodatensis]
MFKKLIIGFFVFLFIMAVSLFVYAKYWGMIPRHDYETVAPVIPKMSKPAVLIFNKTNGYIHHDALPAAQAMLANIARKHGWDIYTTDNGAIHNTNDLAQFKLIVWNNVSGDVLTIKQRQAFKQWLEQGGGWLGIHASGGDPSYQWQWYVDSLIGAQFIGHTMHPQFQNAKINVTDIQEPLTNHLPSAWLFPDEEWYAFDRNPRHTGHEILLTIDEGSYQTVGKSFLGNDQMVGEHPLVWRSTIGQGRAFYSAIGHQAKSYQIKEYVELIDKALVWLMGE